MIKGFARYVDMDMLHGSLWDKIIVFSLPLAFTTLLGVVLVLTCRRPLSGKLTGR